MAVNRGEGTPKTDEERAAAHQEQYGSEELPPRGTGLNRGHSNPGNPGKMPIRIRESVKAAGGTYDYVKSEIVPHGEIWCLQGIAYENETGARGTFRRYIEAHGYNHYVSELQGPGAAELIYTNDVIYLIPGERLVVRQASCTANDVLSLYAHGYKIHSSFIPPVE